MLNSQRRTAFRQRHAILVSPAQAGVPFALQLSATTVHYKHPLQPSTTTMDTGFCRDDGSWM
jgi:hypothetical protein